MAHANEDLLRRGYEAFAAGDIDTVMSIFDGNIAWHIPGRSKLSGDYHGHEQLRGFFGKVMELTAGTFKMETHDFLANDGHVVVLSRARAMREGRSLDSDVCHVWHVRDGKATEFWELSIDPYGDDEFWG